MPGWSCLVAEAGHSAWGRTATLTRTPSIRPPSGVNVGKQNLGRRACRAIEDCPIPTVARVQGHAIGGGMCFAMSCDFRITTPETAWYLPEGELGVPLTWAAIPRLAQEIGTARARQLVMLADRIDGTTAAVWGVAHACVPAAELDATVQSMVEPHFVPA